MAVAQVRPGAVQAQTWANFLRGAFVGVERGGVVGVERDGIKNDVQVNMQVQVSSDPIISLAGILLAALALILAFAREFLPKLNDPWAVVAIIALILCFMCRRQIFDFCHEHPGTPILCTVLIIGYLCRAPIWEFICLASMKIYDLIAFMLSKGVELVDGLGSLILTCGEAIFSFICFAFSKLYEWTLSFFHIIGITFYWLYLKTISGLSYLSLKIQDLIYAMASFVYWLGENVIAGVKIITYGLIDLTCWAYGKSTNGVIWIFMSIKELFIGIGNLIYWSFQQCMNYAYLMLMKIKNCFNSIVALMF